MENHDLNETAGGTPPNPDRRAALAKLGVGAAAAWAAPTILSAPAASAATVTPGCGTCDEQFVINGEAGSGTTAGWVSTAAGNGATFQSVLWTDIADQFIQPIDTGLRAFSIETTTTTTTPADLEQRIALPGCEGATFAFTGYMGSMLSSWDPQFSSLTSVRLELLDSADNALTNMQSFSGGNLVVPAAAFGFSFTPVIPVGAVTARIRLRFGRTLAPQQQGVFSAVFDDIRFVLRCPS